MARRDEAGYFENESNRYQSEDFRSQEPKRLDTISRAGSLRNEHESLRSEGSSHGRDLGRKHSSPAENNYFRQKSTVARKSSRRGSQPDKYLHSGITHDQVPFRRLSQSKSIGQQRHTPRESSQPSQSRPENPTRGPSLDRQNIHLTGFKNSRVEANRPDILNARSGRTNDQTRQRRKRTENSSSRERIPGSSPREHTRRDDFAHYSRTKSPAPTDGFDSIAQHRLGNRSPIAKSAQSSTEFNGVLETNLGHPTWSFQGQHAIDNQYQHSSVPAQSESLSRQRVGPPRLKLPPSSPHNISNGDSADLVASGKLSNGNDAITPISTSAMSISSGSTPPRSVSSSRKNSQHRKTNACIMCKNPQVPVIDLLVRCNQCRAQYHTSCHNPKITCTKGDVDVDTRTWKCQRCVKRSEHPLQAAKISASIAKSPHSTESSEHSSITSENSATQISRGINYLTLYGRGSKSASSASTSTDRYHDLGIQHPRRRSAKLHGNLHDHDALDPHYHNDTPDFDAGPPRKRQKSTTSSPNHRHIQGQQGRAAGRHSTQQIHRNGSLRSVTTPGASSRTSERFEQDRQHEDLSRSSSIFSENRKLAVVIHSRSRSASTSTNSKRGYQELNNRPQTPTTLKDLQEIPSSGSRACYQTSSQTSQPIATGSENDETPSPPRHAPPSEIRGSQDTEGELTDAPMSLGYPEVYSPLPPEPNVSSRASAAWEHSQPQWRSRGEGEFYMNAERPSAHTGQDAQPAKESPRYPPSVGDTNGKDVNGHLTSREYRDPSSPPYSPPPPDISEAPEPANRAKPYIPPPQTTITDNQPTREDGFMCRKCSFYVPNNKQYKDKLCGSCDIETTIRHGNSQIPESSTSTSKVSKNIARPAQSSLSASHPRPGLQQHRNSAPTQSSFPKTLGSTDPSAIAKTSETSKNLSLKESPQMHTAIPVKKFQTSKDRVIEKYHMTFSESPEIQGNANFIIPTNLTNLSKRKREEPVRPDPRRRISINEALEKGKSKAVINSEKSKLNNPAGPARKFPSKPTSTKASLPTRTSRHISVDRSITRDESVPPKKSEWRGPAMKHAGQIFIPIPNEDDNSAGDDEDQVKRLEEKLREQKGYTKKQMEKAVELQRKLMRSEEEKNEMREKQKKLEAALAASQKSAAPPSPKQSRKIKKPKRPAQSTRDDEAKTNNQPIKPGTGNGGSEHRKKPSLKDLYKDYTFTANNPWSYPASTELPAPDPNNFRTQSWHKIPYRPWKDKAKLMNVHVHRQLTRIREPINITTQPSLDSKSSHSGPAENSRSASLNDEPDDDFRWPRGGNRTTFDAFMGIPENMVPSVKDGFLGFRAGILNHRTRRLDRNVFHYKIRVPGVLMDKN